MQQHYSLTRRLFVPGIRAPAEEDEKQLAYWFLFRGYRLLVAREGNGATLPLIPARERPVVASERRHYLGTLDGQPCYAAEAVDRAEPPEGMDFQGLRSLMGVLDEDFFWLAGRAVQIVDWDRTHQFCGRCGSPTADHERERVKVCPQCGHSSYPRLAPAIIVAVTHGDRLLLARSQRHPRGLFSVLAGFVEPGETLEGCVAREVKEEVGLDVQRIRYFGSQPWPFPHSLMIAFTCEATTDAIRLDEVEMQEAAWFTADALPQVPPPPTISRRLIDSFVEHVGRR